jgi:hypothetical protein
MGDEIQSRSLNTQQNTEKIDKHNYLQILYLPTFGLLFALSCFEQFTSGYQEFLEKLWK